MTGSPRPGSRILGSLRSAHGKGVMRIEDRYDTGIDDLWSALTDPGRLAGWYGQVEGDLRPGGQFRLHVEDADVDATGRGACPGTTLTPSSACHAQLMRAMAR
jgi:hypothetical protein